MHQTAPRLLRLDGLRGVAACVISLFFHARIMFGGRTNPLDGWPAMPWFQTWGWSMVDLFFVLSGFIFAHRYLDGWRIRPGTTVFDFALSRFARLWPLHALVLLVVVILLWNFPQTTFGNILLSATMLHAFIADPTETLNGPAWSLSVEVISMRSSALPRWRARGI